MLLRAPKISNLPLDPQPSWLVSTPPHFFLASYPSVLYLSVTIVMSKSCNVRLIRGTGTTRCTVLFQTLSCRGWLCETYVSPHLVPIAMGLVIAPYLISYLYDYIFY